MNNHVNHLGHLYPDVIEPFSPLFWRAVSGGLFFSPGGTYIKEEGKVARLKGGNLSEISLTDDPGLPPLPGRFEAMQERLGIAANALMNGEID